MKIAICCLRIVAPDIVAEELVWENPGAKRERKPGIEEENFKISI